MFIYIHIMYRVFSHDYWYCSFSLNAAKLLITQMESQRKGQITPMSFTLKIFTPFTKSSFCFI